MASWNYTVHKINQSFEQITTWYREFMRRTEQSFRALNDRVVVLEERQTWVAPSDEQVERVLRKILAERFGEHTVPRSENPNVLPDGGYFVEKPKGDFVVPKPIPIEDGILEVSTDAVPSKTYAETFQMLATSMTTFPNVDLSASASDTKPKNAKRSTSATQQSSNNRHHDRPWQ